MKSSLIFLLLFAIISVCNVWESSAKEEKILKDTRSIDSLNSGKLPDSPVLRSEVDTLQKSYSIIIFHLRSRVEQLEILAQKRALIITLLILLSGLLTLFIFRIISRKIPFSSFPFYLQRKGEQPGFVCLQMMYRYYYRKRITYKRILKESPVIQNPNSLSIEDFASTAEKFDFEVKVVKTGLKELCNDLQLPVILYLPNHMAVFFETKGDNFYLSDPFYGQTRTKLFYFASTWFTDQKNLQGITILLYPLKAVKKSIGKKLDILKFRNAKMWNKKNWKNYSCELVISE